MLTISIIKPKLKPEMIENEIEEVYNQIFFSLSISLFFNLFFFVLIIIMIHWFVFLQFSITPQAERDLKHCQEEFDRQIEITKLLLEGITSAQV